MKSGKAAQYRLGQILLLAMSYFAGGRLGLLLAIPPGYATAVWPASGVALAALLLYGYRLWPGVLLGSFFVNIFVSFDSSSLAAIIKSISIAAGVGTGAALQALFGAFLIHRWAHIQSGLTTSKSVLLFIGIGGPISCLVNATWGVSTLWLFKEISFSEYGFSWITWWVGDMIGVIIFLPLLISFLGQPASIWRWRRGVLGGPLIISTGIVVIFFFLASAAEQNRIKLKFHKHADFIGSAFQEKWNSYTEVLYNIRGLMTTMDNVSEEQFTQFLDHKPAHLSGIQAIEWLPVVLHHQRVSFETSMGHFKITERNPDGELIKAAARPFYIPARYISPVFGNEKALGYDVYSNPKRREALEKARDTGLPIATAPINLVQETEHQAGVLVFLPVYQGAGIPASVDGRRKALRGFAVGVFRTGDVLLSALKGQEITHTQTVLVDEDVSSRASELAATLVSGAGTGKLNSNDHAHPKENDLTWSVKFDIGGRTWRLSVIPTSQYLAKNRSWTAWGVLAGGLIFTGLLGIFLLIITGKSIVDKQRASELLSLNIELGNEIKERKQMERELESRETQLRTVIESIPDLVWLKSPDGVYLSCNRKVERLMGDKEANIKGKSDHDFFDKERADLFHLKDQAVLASGRPSIDEEEIIFADDGHKELIEIIKTPIHDPEGNITGVLGVGRDITQRVQSRKALQESEYELNAIYNNAPLVMMLIDENRRVRKMNATAVSMARRSVEKSIGKLGGEALRCFHAFDDEKGCGFGPYCADCVVRKTILETFQRNQEFNRVEAVLPYDHPDGVVEMHVLVSTTPLNLHGEFLVLVCLEDITERKKLEAQFRQTQKMESVGRLAGGVAHDFNNMLSIILGNVEMILEDLDSENPLIPNIDEIQKAAQRSTDLTRQLLAFARKQTISPKILNPNHIIEGMLKMLKRLIGEDIDLQWQPMDSLWATKIDPSQIDQILANLCVNARDAIRDVGKVTIETGNVCFDDDYCREHNGFIPGEYVVIGVSDNGSGMDKETITHLFEPFYTTKKNGQGTGLGLATVYGIVKQNNGFINVYSEREQGTTFKIYLPRYEEDAEQTLKKPIQQASKKGHETILLVEDEDAILKMTKLMLERLGYAVLAANTPDEALRISHLSNIKIDLLITDVVMPFMNGRELAGIMCQSFPNMKCLFMSGYTANVIAHRGVLDKGHNFIGKPFSKQDLSLKIREILDENNTIPGPDDRGCV